MPKFFRFPWASTGDKTAIPDETDVAGFVSYQQGYGNDYARDPASDPLAKLIERDKMNQLFSDLTENVQYWQTHAFPEYITDAQNGGVAYAYDIGAIVRYDDGGGYKVYQNETAGNTNLPTGAGWVEINIARDLVAKNLIINIASNADLTLTASQNLYAKLTVTDTGVLLTTGRNIVVDNVGRLFLFTNSTAQILTVKTAAGTGVAIPAGSSSILVNDGTDVTLLTTGTPTSDYELANKKYVDNSAKVLQVANFTTGEVATITGVIPQDDTIPQITEGTQVMLLDFTPASATSRLKIEVVVNTGSNETTANEYVALFDTAQTDALGVCFGSYQAGTAPKNASFTVFVDSVSTLLRTYTVRIGSSVAATVYFNGFPINRLFGGKIASSITITEIEQ